ncbi:cell division protein FtsQ/DivIB [Shewanella submarina]|uniref:Cell division protein FtsQ n=1 Tax=Shewanella submarina TaxID=2016376 RepID=A0ABV7GKU6_9GAMM|nr:cell division protein FtsQ/DivIB [Shewanella submarina]
MSWKDKMRHWRQRLAAVDWYLVSGLAFLLLVISAFSLSALRLHDLLGDAEALPIESVIIKGDRQYTSDAEIQAALQSLMRRSFFSADVNQVQEALEELPWVYQASVRRKWPARLKVFLQEQQPVAHWNGDKWLNEHGQVFEAPDKEGIDQLPQLAGPDAMAKDVLTSYRQIRELLQINGFGLKSLSLNARHAWRAVLDNGVMLELGREDKMARIQRFINVYPVLAKQPNKVARVDLRYDTGLAVGWDDAQQESR